MELPPSPRRRFVWQAIGRSLYAKVGPLTVEVRATGSYVAGTKRWRVGDVFGIPQSGDWYTDVDAAIAQAEIAALRLAAEIIGAVKQSFEL